MTEYLTIDSISKMFHISKRSIYLFAQKGKIPGAFRVGRHWRFRRDMIEEWIDGQTKTSKSVKNSKKTKYTI